MRKPPRRLAALSIVIVVAAGGCASERIAATAPSYLDDAAISATVRSRLVEEKAVDASAVQVETKNGAVVLSGFAKTPVDKSTVESVAMKVRGVKSVRNDVTLRP